MTPTIAATLPNLESVDTVLERLRLRSRNRHDVFIDDAVDLYFRWEPGGLGGYYMKIDGIDMPLTSGAVKTAAQRINQKNPAWFKSFVDENYFPKSFRNFAHRSGFLIRHDGKYVQAVLPSKHHIADPHQLLTETFLPALTESMGNIHGVIHQFDQDGDEDSFKLVCGQNIIPTVPDGLGQYMMFSYSTSENGLFDTRTWVGLYRSICQSAAIRGQSCSRWTHKSDAENFLSKTGETIRNFGDYSEAFSKVFIAMTLEPLPKNESTNEIMNAMDMLNILVKGGIMTKDHFKMCRAYANQQTEDNRDITTHYDLFTVITRGARDIINHRLREKAEEVAFKIFTSSGGLMETVRRSMERIPDIY